MRQTELLREALRVFADPSTRAPLTFTARSMAGFGNEQFIMRDGDDLPLPLLELAVEGWEIRLSPYRIEGGIAGPLVAAVVVLRPEYETDRGTAHPDITAAGQAAVCAALARMPTPSLLVDGRHEVVAAWRLAKPLSTRDGRVVCVRLAEALGADPDGPDEPLTWTVPVAGVVRNWTTIEPSLVRVIAADPLREYSLRDLTPKDVTS